MLVEYTGDPSSVSLVEPACSSSTSDDSEELPPINFRFSVFFDGTGNNLFNTNYLTDTREATGTGRTVGDREHRGSYLASYSNNARLATNLVITNTENNYHIPVYVDGIGTYHMRADDDRGMGFGSDHRGIIERVSSCIIRIHNSIVTLSNGNRHIQNLKIDVFGFSRGAAAARYFVHRVLEYDSELNIGSLIYRLTHRSHGFLFNIDNYEMPFVGLFDTVGSYRTLPSESTIGTVLISPMIGIPEAIAETDLSIENDTVELHLNSIRHHKVKQVVHLAAADEHRANFPLTNINSAGTHKGTQIFLPGVHSDIGGGYNNDSHGDMRENRLSIYELEGERYQYDEMFHTCERVMANLFSLGWYNDSPSSLLELEVHWEPTTGNYRLLATRNNINNKYSWIALHIMAEKAGDKDLHFDLTEFPLSDDSRLVGFKARIENNTHSDQDWMTAHDPQLKDMRHSFFHFSSHFTPDASTGLAWPMKPQLQNRVSEQYASNDLGADNEEINLALNLTAGPIQSIRKRMILDG
jgi:hypothetical protein